MSTPDSPPVFVLGAGGHARVVADLVRAHHAFAGYVDMHMPHADTPDIDRQGGRVVLTQHDLLASHPGARLALGVGSNPRRLAIFESLSPSHDTPALIHPSAVISPGARVRPGTTVMARVVVNAHADIGLATILNTACVVEHDCSVADGAHISPGAILCGGVHIGKLTWVGAGAVVIQGVRVGAHVTIGAGAVVTRDLPDGVTAVGVPARIIHSP